LMAECILLMTMSIDSTLKSIFIVWKTNTNIPSKFCPS
jgi:hypothetical protein